MLPLSDRQIVERIVLPTLMKALVQSVRNDLGDDGAPLQAILDLLGEAIREPLSDMRPDRSSKLTRRAVRAATAAMSAVGNNTYGVQWMAVARFIVTLTEEDIIAVGEESAFGRAFDAMVTIGLGTVKGKQDEAVAEKLAASLRVTLGSQGLFI